MHLVSSTFNPPSAVLYSLACSFRGSNERYLVVAKTNSLQLYALNPQGTELMCEQEIWGSPKGLEQLASSKHLVLALDIPQARIVVLDFDPQSKQLHVHHTSSVSPLTHRPSISFSGLLVNEQTVCASFYNGHVKLLSVGAKGSYEVKESDLRVHELTIRTMCFTLPSSNNVLAIVYTNQYGQAWLIGREASTMAPSTLIPEKDLDSVPDLVIPVRIQKPSEEDVFGILLVAHKQITFLKTGIDHSAEEEPQSGRGKGKGKDRTNSKSDVKMAIQASAVTMDVPFQDIAAWTQVDGTHLLVGDYFGRLYLLTMSMEPQFVMTSVLLGEVSVPSTLSYLSDNVVYIGSYSAPSQLVRISDNISELNAESLGKKKHASEDDSYLEIMTSHSDNIAPIMDATLVDADGSGQSRIATISGDESGGSLNIVHRGASFRESAVLDGLANLENLFPLKKHYGALSHTYLGATTNVATFLFSFSSGGLSLIEPGDLPGISRTTRTILLDNIDLPGLDSVVHVTPNSVSVIDLNTGRCISAWNPWRGDIMAAAVDATTSTLCVATSQGDLFSLNIQSAGIVKSSECSFKQKVHYQISALATSQNMVAATFWGSNETLFMTLPGLRVSKSTVLVEPSAASSVYLTNFGEGQLYFIVARLDGTLSVQVISPDGTALGRRLVPLGGGPISLSFIPAQDSKGAQVIAAGKQAVTLSIVKKRLNISSLPIKDVCAISALVTPGFNSLMVYATPTGLVFGQIEQLEKLNINSFNLGSDSPLYLAYHPQLSSYAVGCMRVSPNMDNERHFVRFIDESTFSDLGHVKLQYQESITSIAPYAHAGTLCMIVGTGHLRDGENEARSGRILVFKANNETRMFKLEFSKDVEGAVPSIKQFKHSIIVAVNDRVYVFDLTKKSDTMAIEEPIAKWERAYSIGEIIIRDDMIVVSDKLRSVSVLRLVEETIDTTDDDDDETMEVGTSSSVRLETVAMDMGAVWPNAVGILDDGKTIIAAQLDGNILTWEIDGNRLESRAGFYVGEVINKYITLPPRPSSSTRPVALFVTNSGRIGMLSTVDDEDALQLTRLELQMDKAIKGLGGMRHSDWRAPKLFSSSKKPPPRRGITDGDFIKKLLELDDESAKKILSQGTAAERIGGAEEEQIRRCLEALSTDQ